MTMTSRIGSMEYYVAGLTLILALFVADASAASQIVTPSDTIPDFCEAATISAVRSGSWSSPSTWNLGRVPGAADKVAIASGHTVTFDLPSTPSLDCVGIRGTLTFRPDTNTRLTVGTILVYDVGSLIIGTATTPVSSGNTAEIIIANQPLNASLDPDQYGTGLLAWGSVTMFGSVRSRGFVRTASEPRSGQVTVTLSEPVSGWRAGDVLWLPDSTALSVTEWAESPYVDRSEYAQIQSVAADGRTIALTSPLRFDHPGARDHTGKVVFLPHVVNASRNIEIRSATQTGTRGHVFLTHRARINIQNTSFKHLGRTRADAISGSNPDGRFPVYLAHLWGPATPPDPYQFTLKGNVVHGDATLPDLTANRLSGITLEDSHFGLIEGNTILGTGGVGLHLRSTEHGNRIVGNFFGHIPGNGLKNITLQIMNMVGTTGSGMRITTSSNEVHDNVAANVLLGGDRGELWSAGFMYELHPGPIEVPPTAGAERSQYTSVAMPAITEFKRNEYYGPQALGFFGWDIGQSRTSVSSVIKDMKIWNTPLRGVDLWTSRDVIIDGLVAVYDATKADGYFHYFGVGIMFSTFANSDKLVVSNSTISGFGTGIVLPGNLVDQGSMRIGNVNFANWTDIYVPYIAEYAGRITTPRRIDIDRPVFHHPLPGESGRTKSSIAGQSIEETINSSVNIMMLNEVKITAYNGIPGNNFQFYYNEQVPSFVPPASSGSFVGSPQAGLTNQQLWSSYRQAVAGAVAPCTDTATRPEVGGITCPLAVGSPPAPPTGLRIVR